MTHVRKGRLAKERRREGAIKRQQRNINRGYSVVAYTERGQAIKKDPAPLSDFTV